MHVYIRKTYFNIDCDNNSIGARKAKLQSMINNAGLSWPNGQAAIGSTWQEYKVGTVSSRRVLLLLEIGRDTGVFYDFTSLRALVLRQKNHRFHLSETGKVQAYRLFNYIPFRSQDHQQYQQCKSQSEQLACLKQRLQFHLEHLANHLQIRPKRALLTGDLKMIRQKKTRLSGHPHYAFDLQFSSTLFIPEFLGLGLGTGVGCGVVRQLNGSR